MPQRVTLPSAQTIQLRDVAVDDLPTLFEHQRDPEANKLAAFPARSRDAFMAHWAKIVDDESVRAKTIVLDGCIAGNVISWPHDGKRLVGYWIGRDHWGQGVATRALSAYLRIVTDRPLHAYVAKQNAASIRVLEKCGFGLCVEETRALGETFDGVEEFVYSLHT
jgi:RimJ/RimL family protein N-acetyltransferase